MNVVVKDAKGLPEDLCTDPYVTYQLGWETSQKEYKTEAKGYGANNAFNYSNKHTIDCVNEYHISTLQNGQLAFCVWAYPYFKGSKGAFGVAQTFQVSEVAPKFKAAETPRDAQTPANASAN